MVLLTGLSGCSGLTGSNPDKTLRIVAGSEQRSILDQIVVPWCEDHGYTCDYTLLGSVDQARTLQSGSTDYDAYWFASSVFAQLGNTDGKLRDLQPMFLTPVVFAGWRSTMEQLGFVGRDDVTISDIAKVVEGDQVRVWTTNPTQSNSGATTLFAFLNHFAGNGPGEPLTAEQLDTPTVDQGIRAFVQGMDRTPPSTGTMMEECVASPDACDTMFTYEALVIEQNQQLVAQGKEPFYAVYPKGSLAISDAPFGFLPTGDHETEKHQIFTELQTYLLTDAGAQQQLLGLGRRPADSVGLTLDNPDTAVFNPDWGIATDIKEQGIAYPAAAVIEDALDRYHTRYRRPVATYYCLDGSGSMNGDGWKGVEAAAHEVFDPDRARVNLLQTGPDDSTTVQIFDDGPAAGPWTVDGNDATQLKGLENEVVAYEPGGGTDMYACLSDATTALSGDQRKKLIVLMSDGRSTGDEQGGLERARSAGIPIVAIAFGDADPGQLQPLAEASGGAYVESSDLVAALREAAGYR